MTLETNRMLGLIGAILLFVGFIPVQYLAILSLIGLILVLIALYGFANYYREKGIFNNMIYGIIAGIIGSVVAGIVVLFAVWPTIMSLLYIIYPTWDGNWATLAGLTPDISNLTPEDVFPLLGGMISVLIVAWITIIIFAFFARRSLNSLSAKTNVHLFSTAGLLLLIGALLAIVVVGFILIWIAILLIAIAFYQIKTQPMQPSTVVPPPPPTPVSR